MDLESRLIALALEEGRISRGDVEAAGRVEEELPSAVWGPRVAALVHLGRLEGSWVRRSAQALMAPEGTSAGELEDPASEGPAWEVHTSPGLPGGSGRYAGLKLVAVGGQGRVYRARDTQLDREVALKFLRWEGAHQREGLLREGRAQAKVTHPGVCPILEVGEMGGEAFLALPWVEGPAFREALPGLDVRARLDLLVQACEAVHAAHLQGLVHLDLKPGNLLLERLPDGSLRVRVGDFGLAWQAGQAPLGRVGTPPYASPEQLQGAASPPGPPADMYALGVLLHLVLTGRLPHEAGPGGLKGDAARVFAKATALDPASRHPSARDLARDLQALRDGRPLPSLPTPLGARVRLWVRRHRGGAAALAVGGALLALAVGQMVRQRLQGRAQARLAQRFGQDVQEVEFLLQRSHLSPPRDLRPTLARVRRTMDRIRAEMQGLGPEAQAEGWYALGRAHQLLGEDGEARDGLEKAWAGGKRSPDCAQALGLARAEAYLDETRNLGVDLVRAPDHPALAELRRRNALPAADLLALAAKEKPDAARILDAVRADIEGRPQDAERLASEALQAPDSEQPWEVLPWRILALFWEYRAQSGIAAGDMARARSQLRKAWSALDRATEAARSDPYLRMTEGWLHFTEAHILENEKLLLRSEQELDRAVAAFAQAGRLQPDLLLARKYVVDGLRRKVSLRRRFRLPAREAVRDALEALDRLEPRDRENAGLRQVVRRVLTEALLVAWAGGAPLDCAEARRLRAELKAGTPPLEAELAGAELDLACARELLRRGGEARPYLDAARGPLSRARERDPQDPARLEAWVAWSLADAEARLRAGRPLDGPAMERLAAELEGRTRRDQPSEEMSGWVRELRRLRARAVKAP